MPWQRVTRLSKLMRFQFLVFWLGRKQSHCCNPLKAAVVRMKLSCHVALYLLAPLN